MSYSPLYLPTSSFRAELQSQRRALKRTKDLENTFTQRYIVKRKDSDWSLERGMKKGQDKNIRVSGDLGKTGYETVPFLVHK